MSDVTRHFVEFLSPGTFMAESTRKPIDSWDVEAAKEMAMSVKERHGACPYGFRFITQSRGPDDLDSKQTARSPMYFLGGEVRTLEEVERDNLPDENILRSNMQGNGYKRIITNCNSWKWTQPLADDDVVLEFALPHQEEIPEMVERVARALALSAGCRMLTEGQSVATREFGWDIGHKYTEKYVEAHWKDHVHAAGFAIEAMREPTNAMVWAHEVPHYGPDEAREAWRSMIDVALSKGERNG